MTEIQQIGAVESMPHNVESAEDVLLQSTVIAMYYGLDIDPEALDLEDPNIPFNTALSNWVADGRLSKAYRDIVTNLKLTDSDLNNTERRKEIAQQIASEIQKLHPRNITH